MDATVTETESPQASTPARKADARKLFKYSAYLHVGEGAEDCEHALDGGCEDESHFHAWCRLPNAIQQEDIRKKALAAKARTIRGYKDKDADATITLDNELAQIDDPAFLDALVDDLIARDFVEDYTEAQRNVIEAPDSEFEHINEDRERYTELGGSNMPVVDMTDEHRQLHEHIGKYIEAVQENLRNIQAPKRDELAERGLDKLVRLVRVKRVEQDGDQAFIDTYNRWMWFVGTYTTELHPKLKRPHMPMWREIGSAERPVAESMFAAAPEVLDALRQTFNELQLAFSQGSSGN
jgi:hypothetical protein